MTLLLEQKLPETSTNKQKCDDFCVSFVTASCGNKGRKGLLLSGESFVLTLPIISLGPRKRLATALSKIPRNRSDLAPGYARYYRRVHK
jgi:hypothetical protein